MLDLCAENRACEIVVVQGFVVAGLPWGGVGPGGPSLGQCGEFLSTAPPPGNQPFWGLSIPEGRGRELPGPHFRHTTQKGGLLLFCGY